MCQASFLTRIRFLLVVLGTAVCGACGGGDTSGEITLVDVEHDVPAEVDPVLGEVGDLKITNSSVATTSSDDGAAKECTEEGERGEWEGQLAVDIVCSDGVTLDRPSMGGTLGVGDAYDAKVILTDATPGMRTITIKARRMYGFCLSDDEPVAFEQTIEFTVRPLEGDDDPPPGEEIEWVEPCTDNPDGISWSNVTMGPSKVAPNWVITGDDSCWMDDDGQDLVSIPGQVLFDRTAIWNPLSAKVLHVGGGEGLVLSEHNDALGDPGAQAYSFGTYTQVFPYANLTGCTWTHADAKYVGVVEASGDGSFLDFEGYAVPATVTGQLLGAIRDGPGKPFVLVTGGPSSALWLMTGPEAAPTASKAADLGTDALPGDRTGDWLAVPVQGPPGEIKLFRWDGDATLSYAATFVLDAAPLGVDLRARPGGGVVVAAALPEAETIEFRVLDAAASVVASAKVVLPEAPAGGGGGPPIPPPPPGAQVAAANLPVHVAFDIERPRVAVSCRGSGWIAFVPLPAQIAQHYPAAPAPLPFPVAR